MVQEIVPAADVRTRLGFGWRRLAVTTAVATSAGHLLIGAAYRDLDAIAIAVSYGVALGVTRLRRGTVGFVLLGLAFANVAFWTVPAAVTNLSGRSGFAAVAVPGVMAVLSLTGLLATMGTLRTGRRGDGGEAAVTRVTAAAIAVLVLVFGVATLRGDAAVVAEPDDLVLLSDSTAFSPPELVATTGTIGVYLENRDYFWHTFTISELGVDLRVPVGAAGRVTFEAAPGTYEFVCAIPGHDIAGMVGTLTVVDG